MCKPIRLICALISLPRHATGWRYRRMTQPAHLSKSYKKNISESFPLNGPHVQDAHHRDDFAVDVERRLPMPSAPTPSPR